MIKLQRSGFTETNLIFIDSWTQEQLPQHLIDLQNLDINRIYSKAGFYDKNIEGTYFDINTKQVKNSENFHRWLIEYKKSLYNCDYLEAMSHIRSYPIYETFRPLLEKFIDSLKHNNMNTVNQYRNFWKKPHTIYHILDKQKILIVNSFGSLIYRQYTSGNVHKIFPDFPNLSDIDYIDFPYTFFNNGPHQNFFETLDYYMHIIQKKAFDIALVACGPYGCIMVDRIRKALNKNAITIGSGITPMFGIDPKKQEPYWTHIPPQYIPKNYEKIEKGRYWT
jgi:hypothetical protein